jgi:hypothetical protein
MRGVPFLDLVFIDWQDLGEFKIWRFEKIWHFQAFDFEAFENVRHSSSQRPTKPG